MIIVLHNGTIGMTKLYYCLVITWTVYKTYYGIYYAISVRIKYISSRTEDNIIIDLCAVHSCRQGAADNDTVNLLMHNSNDRIIYDGIT